MISRLLDSLKVLVVVYIEIGQIEEVALKGSVYAIQTILEQVSHSGDAVLSPT